MGKTFLRARQSGEDVSADWNVADVHFFQGRHIWDLPMSYMIPRYFKVRFGPLTRQSTPASYGQDA